MRAFVGVLEPAPAADVVDQDCLEVGDTGLDVVDQLPERVTPLDPETALARVRVGAHDLEVARFGVALDRHLLVLGRVLLMLGGHADVLRRPPCAGGSPVGSDPGHGLLGLMEAL